VNASERNQAPGGMPMPFGTQLRGDFTQFRLWAPARSAITLEIGGLAPIEMRRDEQGFFFAQAHCGAGARYRYRLDTDLAVPDPASRQQAGDVHDCSVVVDPNRYVWRQRDWRGRPWREIVIYELHVGCCGGFRGVERRLPALAELGITAVELMPIADFSGRRGWGYDGVLPFAPDTSYGTPDELKHLIDTAHGLGICVYLDVVYNHFGPDGNYLHAYAPQFFTAQQSQWGEVIDFAQPQVREFFAQNVSYWLHEYRFDGLRFDAVHALNDRSWLDEVAARVRLQAEPTRHIHLMLENEKNEAGFLERDYDAQWNDDGHNALHVLLTGECDSYYRNYCDAPAQKLARVLGEGFAYQGDPSPTHNGAARGTPSRHLPPHAFILFLQNHDQIGNRAFGERLTRLADRDALRAAVALQLLCPQIPLLFMGEEWGAETPFLFFTDFHDELAAAVREGRRREFAASAAFADARKRAKIPDPNAERTFIQSIPDFDAARRDGHAEWLYYYRNLLRLRREFIVPWLSDARHLEANVLGPAAVLASWHLGGSRQLHIAVNLAPQEVAIAAPGGRLLIESRPGTGARAERGYLLGRATAVWLDMAAAAQVNV
jgi:maltooligosyltrehalose trehalohydrolase